MIKKLGIFAGTFDPVHLGHSAFVEQSIAEHDLDKVLVIVEKTPRFKTCIAAYTHRKKMVELAFAGNQKVAIYESRSEDFPITESLPTIRAEYSKARLFLLIGEDVAKHIDMWQNAEDLLKDVQRIIGKRGGHEQHGSVSSLKIRNILREQARSHELDRQVQHYIVQNKLYKG